MTSILEPGKGRKWKVRVLHDNGVTVDTFWPRWPDADQWRSLQEGLHPRATITITEEKGPLHR